MPAEDSNSNYKTYYEAEHQELWYPDSDLSKPVAVHIPSALGKIGYYVCVRVPQDWADKLDGVKVKADIGGLYPDDLLLSAGENITGEDAGSFPSTGGCVWRLLCKAPMSRGDGTLRFMNFPQGIARADLLLCSWTRYIASGLADDWLACRNDPLWTPTGIPLGGIGTGRVDICRDGRFRNFSANNNQDMPLEDPAGIAGAFLSVECGGDAVTLTSTPVNDAKHCASLAFDGRFPQAVLTAKNCLPGIDATVAATGMTAPHDLRRSSIPGMLLRWKIRNNTRQTQNVRCSFSWHNLIGIGGGIAQEESGIGKGDGRYCYWEDTQGNAQHAVENDTLKGVVFSGNGRPIRLSSAGQHLLAVKKSETSGSQVEDEQGMVWQEMTLAAESEAQGDMALVWEMPHWIDMKGADRGHLWQNYFKNAEEIAGEILLNADDIFEQTGLLARLLDDTSLPAWLKARLLNCNYPLTVNSVLYRDGRFSINEGPTEMNGCYGTLDQRLAAHPATYLFFPELNDRELTQFSNVQAENGGMNHDFGAGHLESPPQDRQWPDLGCSFIIQTARHAWSTGDDAFEDAMWPKAKKALQRVAQWAEQGGGVPQVGKGLGTSYDGYHYLGTTPYLATLWLAALQIAAKWARKKDDTGLLPQIDKWKNDAIRRLETDCWNGSFYRTCASSDGSSRETAHSGMIAGQVFTRLLAGRNVLPDDRLAACTDALLRLNGGDRFIVPPDEADADGNAATAFGWLPYIEAFCLASVATARDCRVMTVWERATNAVTDSGRRLCDTRLMYRPHTGEPSWGAWYMTAPASWLVYDALLDFTYTPESGLLRLNPLISGRLAVLHPLWWGIAETNDDSVGLTIRQVFTERDLRISGIELLREKAGVAAEYEVKPLGNPVEVKPGARLNWSR